jgi:hypothetical protein
MPLKFWEKEELSGMLINILAMNALIHTNQLLPELLIMILLHCLE